MAKYIQYTLHISTPHMVPQKVLQGLWGLSPLLRHTPDSSLILSAESIPPSFLVLMTCVFVIA